MTYSYTKPKGPVAAMYNGPGPGYALPSLCGYFNHDPQSTHCKLPAYSFGQRRKQSGLTRAGPGPNYYNVDVKLTKHSAPRYVLCGRPRETMDNCAPDPASYGDTSKCQMASRRAPAYSFGGRYPDHSLDYIPGPNAYKLPPAAVESRKRRAPSHIIASRNKTGGFHNDLQMTPGPAAYDVTDPRNYRPRPPNFSMAPRRDLPGDSTSKPGPGAHRPESVQVHKRSAPKFSFGSRHSAYAVSLIVPA